MSDEFFIAALMICCEDQHNPSPRRTSIGVMPVPPASMPIFFARLPAVVREGRECELTIVLHLPARSLDTQLVTDLEVVHVLRDLSLRIRLSPSACDRWPTSLDEQLEEALVIVALQQSDVNNVNHAR